MSHTATNKFLLSAGLGAALLFAVDHQLTLQRRIQELELTPTIRPEEVAKLRSELLEVEHELNETRERLESDDRAEVLEERLTEFEGLMGRTDLELAEHNARLSTWESRWEGREPDSFERSLQELRVGLETRWRNLDELANEAAAAAAEGRERIAAIDRELTPLKAARDPDRMWHELVGPVVQLAGDATVGSGVLLESQPVDEDGRTRHVTHLLTSWHVVRDIYGSLDRVHEPIAVKIYLEDGRVEFVDATMLVYDVALDAALLKLAIDEPVAHGARLASRERLEGLQVFDPVYAVGCPLGNDPIPTAGEVASTQHLVDGSIYWMISAPTYIGNSGGGIFDAQSHELIGIFSKIYTHGSLRSTIVPHMGLVTPLSTIYDWLEVQGYASLEMDANARGAEAKLAAASATKDY